jgi:superfamily I DNA and/or RNA helicase
LGILGAKHDGKLAVKRVVFIGDHKQLPAVVKQSTEESHVDHPLLHEAQLTNCRESLFERMIKHYSKDEHITYTLHRQGRMHHDIALFPNTVFYHGMLTEATPEQCAPLDNTTNLDNSRFHIASSLFSHRVAFINVSTKIENTSSDKVNLAEASLIADIAITTYQRDKKGFCPQHTLGIIVPYRNQITAVRQAIAKHNITPLNDITIDTVERYQGSQRDIIIYGFTAHSASQLDFLTEQTFMEGDTLIDRKLNVVMTRARQHLFMVGNSTLLSTNKLFARLIDFVDRHDGIIDSKPSVQGES